MPDNPLWKCRLPGSTWGDLGSDDRPKNCRYRDA